MLNVLQAVFHSVVVDIQFLGADRHIAAAFQIVEQSGEILGVVSAVIFSQGAEDRVLEGLHADDLMSQVHQVVDHVVGEGEQVGVCPLPLTDFQGLLGQVVVELQVGQGGEHIADGGIQVVPFQYTGQLFHGTAVLGGELLGIQQEDHIQLVDHRQLPGEERGQVATDEAAGHVLVLPL